MESGNPVAGLIGLWMFLKLAGFVAVLAGGLYALYCLSRAASSIERVAIAMEDWIAQQNHRAGGAYGSSSPSQYGAPSAPYRPQAAETVSPPPPIPPA